MEVVWVLLGIIIGIPLYFYIGKKVGLPFIGLMLASITALVYCDDGLSENKVNRNIEEVLSWPLGLKILWPGFVVASAIAVVLIGLFAAARAWWAMLKI